MSFQVEIANIASLNQETHRRPDPCEFVIDRARKQLTVDGEPVEKYILRGTPLQEAEYQAFADIKSWVFKNASGRAVWFSPPMADTLTSKITISEIRANDQGGEVLLNRHIVLDTDAKQLLNFANNLSPLTKINDPEELRRRIITPSEDEYLAWFDRLGLYTNQVEMIKKGLDIITKNESLARARDLVTTVPLYNLYSIAQRRGLFGKSPDSCNFLKPQSAFEFIFNSSQPLTLTKTSEWEYHKGKCRDCGGENVNVGPCSICQSCEKKYN